MNGGVVDVWMSVDDSERTRKGRGSGKECL